jgi:prolyl 4-hydroxylase
MASIRSLLSTVGVLAALQIAVAASNQTPITDLSDYVCEHPPYQVLMVSKSPLVIYISNFITPEERAHLQRVTCVFVSLSLSLSLSCLACENFTLTSCLQ